MRPVLIAVGVIVLAMGAVWALQGAWLLPATFMRGPGWIGIGAAVALVGLVVAFLGFRGRPTGKSEANVSPKPRA
ncbi:MAG TPA: hypothetical protein VII27_03650 [Thermoplasmata archaeon]